MTRAYVKLPDADLARLCDVLREHGVKNPYDLMAEWIGCTASAVQKSVLKQRRARSKV